MGFLIRGLPQWAKIQERLMSWGQLPELFPFRDSCAAIFACLVSVTSWTFSPAGVVMLHKTIDPVEYHYCWKLFFFLAVNWSTDCNQTAWGQSLISLLAPQQGLAKCCIVELDSGYNLLWLPFLLKCYKLTNSVSPVFCFEISSSAEVGIWETNGVAKAVIAFGVWGPYLKLLLCLILWTVCREHVCVF